MRVMLFTAALLLASHGAVAQGRSPTRVTVKVINAKGRSVGTATLLAKNGGVTVRLDLRNLPPGEHALHFHEHPACTTPDFKSAGGHFNPEHREHGTHNPAGPHAGDLPNITVGPNGKIKTTVQADRVTLAEGKNSLLANGGTAIVIHAQADDMKSNPAGNAGARIACGVIRP